MPGVARAEIYFIAAMFILIAVICTVAVYFFFRTYKSEMKQKREKLAKKQAEKADAS